MHFVGGEFSRKPFGTAVGDKVYRIPAPLQLVAQSFGWKQMAAGPAGG
jgi:hypothetical protein